jgi:hypothetical protein
MPQVFSILTFMKKIALFFVLFFGVSFAAKENYNAPGVWLGRGGGWGIDFKHLNNNNTYWDAYLGNFGIGSIETKISIDVGYYFLFNVIKADASVGAFPLHVGPDLGFHWWSSKSNSSLSLGPSITGGISWIVPTTPKLDVSLELVSPPVIALRYYSKEKDSDFNVDFLEGELGFRLLLHVYLF